MPLKIRTLHLRTRVFAAGEKERENLVEAGVENVNTKRATLLTTFAVC